jgi:DNA-binding PadR family transcriptional regulator
VSPVFRHGRLRLYLLKLLDESPRHGYEVIRLLQDRFMGVYAPSPGTIYPRLARLEEEGLVTHDEADGRKVYRITDQGREELRNRADDLSELEDEITASVRDIAREVTEDVRETVRNLREELTYAARDMHRRGTSPRDTVPPRGTPPRGGTGSARRNGDGARGMDWADPGAFRDLEQLARRFTRELRATAAQAQTQAQAVSEDAIGDLRTILDDALDRIRTEVFGRPGAPWTDAPGQGGSQPGDPGPDAPGPDAPRPDAAVSDAPGDAGDPGRPR